MNWREELFELSEKYCDHKKLKGDCLYHILEPFITQIEKDAVERTKNEVGEIMRKYEDEDGSQEDRCRYGWKEIREFLETNKK